MVKRSNMTEKHYRIGVLFAGGGLQKREIAEKVGVHPNTVTRALKMPEIQALVRELQARVEEKTVTNLADAFDEAAEGAFHKLMDLMENAPPGVAFRVAESILDRSRTAPKRQIHQHGEQVVVNQLVLEKSQVDVILETAAVLGEMGQPVIDSFHRQMRALSEVKDR